MIDLEAHREMLTWVLERLGEAGLVKGQTIAIDATTLEQLVGRRPLPPGPLLSPQRRPPPAPW